MPGKGSDFESCMYTSGGTTFKLRARVVIAGNMEARGTSREESKKKNILYSESGSSDEER